MMSSESIPTGLRENHIEGTTINNHKQDAFDADEFVDDYDHTEPNVFYTTHNIPGPGIDTELFYSQISRKCNCSTNEAASVKTGMGNNHLELEQSENKTNSYAQSTVIKEVSDAKSKNEHFDDNIEYQQGLCIKNCQCNLPPNYINRKLNVDGFKLPIYECNNLCGCNNTNADCENSERECSTRQSFTKCSNRVIQNGPNKHLEIFRHAKLVVKGYGIKAAKAISKGEFICEYVGEVIDKVEAKRRYVVYKKQYLMQHQQYEQQQKVVTENDGHHVKEPKENFNFYIFHLNEIIDHSEASNHLKSNNPSKDIDTSTRKSHKQHSVTTKITKLPSNPTTLSTTAEYIGSSSKDDAWRIDHARPFNQSRSIDSTFEMFIDATAFGNIARYVNHSCDPNCLVLPVRVNSIYPSLGIFARRNIEPGEELGYDYAGLDDNDDDGQIVDTIDEGIDYARLNGNDGDNGQRVNTIDEGIDYAGLDGDDEQRTDSIHEDNQGKIKNIQESSNKVVERPNSGASNTDQNISESSSKNDEGLTRGKRAAGFPNEVVKDNNCTSINYTSERKVNVGKSSDTEVDKTGNNIEDESNNERNSEIQMNDVSESTTLEESSDDVKDESDICRRTVKSGSDISQMEMKEFDIIDRVVKDDFKRTHREVKDICESTNIELEVTSETNPSTIKINPLKRKVVLGVDDRLRKNFKEDNLTPCFCGSEKCRKFLPYLPLQ